MSPLLAIVYPPLVRFAFLIAFLVSLTLAWLLDLPCVHPVAAGPTLESAWAPSCARRGPRDLPFFDVAGATGTISEEKEVTNLNPALVFMQGVLRHCSHASGLKLAVPAQVSTTSRIKLRLFSRREYLFY